MSVPQGKIRQIISTSFMSFPFIGFIVPVLTGGNWKLGLIAAAMFTPFSLAAYIIFKRKKNASGTVSKGTAAIFTISEVKHINKTDTDKYRTLIVGSINKSGSEYKVQKEFHFCEADMRFLQPGNRLPVMVSKKNKQEFEIMMQQWREALNS